MSVHYRSTRGKAASTDFWGVTLEGLATDGGLYVPEIWPTLSLASLQHLKGAPYQAIAFEVMRPFIHPSLETATLKELLLRAYQGFHNSAITPLKAVDERRWVLELFHGPTLAFKDVALQFLGVVFEHYLQHNQARMTVLGATSGDTGSAAMTALAGRKNIEVFILYPAKGPSDIQRKQMTCLAEQNVHALAIDGSFDDCQAIVKELFGDLAFRRQQKLAAVNSINWLRILAQMVYYFVAAIELGPEKPLSFVVPTGNFGNVYAAYAAMKCGLPVSKLAVASNRNDSLTRFFQTGTMQVEGVYATLSPSMDIQISSNFERYLFDLCQQDGAKVEALMGQLARDKSFTLSPVQLGMARQVFTAASITDAQTLDTIKETYKTSGNLLDPHSAVGMAAAKQLERELPDPVVVLACAHPAKFPDTLERAVGFRPELPADVAALLQRTERLTSLPAEAKAVRRFIETTVAL